LKVYFYYIHEEHAADETVAADSNPLIEKKRQIADSFYFPENYIEAIVPPLLRGQNQL
jgi:hypothetical protein